MNRSDAMAIVDEYVKNPQLINHMLSVEAAMRWYAERLHQDVELWGTTGLLHDFDWEIHPSAPAHPVNGAPILVQKGVPEEIVHAILGHADYTGVARDTLLSKGLYACDEVTGLITACVLVRPSKSIYDLEVSSVKKKWKNLRFAAGANRDEIAQAAEEFNVELWTHVGNIIASMSIIAEDIGLAGNSE